MACTNHSAENETESASHFSITYEDKQISITCTLENKKPAECTFAVDFADRAETKNALKENLYHLLEEVTGQSLPWGTLTGIRPTKIPMQLLDEGKTKEEALRLSDIFLRMIKGEASEDEIQELEEGSALEDISHMPARVKCAVLGWRTLNEILKES